MASIEESSLPAEVLPPMSQPAQPRPSRSDCRQPTSLLSERDEEGTEVPPHDIDTISIDSSQSIPDSAGRKWLTFDDEHITTAYEAWELALMPETVIRQSTKSFFGINVCSTWLNENDSFILSYPIPSFDQGELAQMHEDAIRGYKHRRGADQRKAYEQDLANRAYSLPVDIYDRIRSNINEKTIVTNGNSHRKREWRVAVLQPSEFRMTELLPQRKRKHLFSRERRQPATDTWFVILRGEEVKSNKEDGGWRRYNRGSNPWWRLDLEETKAARDQRKDILKRIDKAHNLRQHPQPPEQGPPPAGPLNAP